MRTTTLNTRELQRAAGYVSRMQCRHQSSQSDALRGIAAKPISSQQKDVAPLSLLPTGTLLRSLLFSEVMSSWLLTPSLGIMRVLTHSKSRLLDPEKNRLMDKLLRMTIYNHFCAGSNAREIQHRIAEIKNMGFKGVILGYAKDVVVDPTDSAEEATLEAIIATHGKVVEQWKQGNLLTLSMIEPGDYLAVKFTGAGPAAVEALSKGQDMPKSIADAMDEVCAEAARRNIRLWIDAEQQVFQDAIDDWTIALMRKYNRDGNAIVYNTIQAYLKNAPENVNRHLLMAEKEGWAFGLKLVRGAYIAQEVRSSIHDTKEETDACYDFIVDSLLKRQFTGKTKGSSFPPTQLFLASHNAESVRKGFSLHQSRTLAGEPTIPVEFGQLQGMADEISCELVSQCRKLDYSSNGQQGSLPGAFKCLAWGTTAECLAFLFRRATENKTATARTKSMALALRKELWRRIFRSAQA
ncbi:FAD-linked oxidoreductase [Xylona heveae TC161]|uniref:Proline dehydrogenase n=1 Tax=Xylona heveae (strain CBS 132557 / TC161) TaxID=1328760 RepID=A0A165FSX6_XYLHT|nr:FAD-linked oxidoreductase [Xylona heveae TC161]KZF21335.1 FAD-linked oxidoreductase [Xylona heveae TC161]